MLVYGRNAQMLQYRKAINRFQEISEQRANSQMESSLQMELLNRIASSQRGLTTSSSDRSAILNLIERLEKANSNGSGADDASTKGEFEDDLEGKWHLEYISNVGNGEQEADGWDFAESTELNKSKRVGRLFFSFFPPPLFVGHGEQWLLCVYVCVCFSLFLYLRGVQQTTELASAHEITELRDVGYYCISRPIPLTP